MAGMGQGKKKGNKKGGKKAGAKTRSKGQVDMYFMKKLWEIVKILFPRWNCRETKDIMLLTFCLFCRTFLSIYISGV